MTGSTLAVIIIPIVALLALGSWLGLVYYADAHPQHQHAGARQADLAPGLPASDSREGVTRREEVTRQEGVSAAARTPRPRRETAPGEAAPSFPAHSFPAHSGAGRGDASQSGPDLPGRHAA